MDNCFYNTIFILSVYIINILKNKYNFKNYKISYYWISLGFTLGLSNIFTKNSIAVGLICIFDRFYMALYIILLCKSIWQYMSNVYDII